VADEQISPALMGGQ